MEKKSQKIVERASLITNASLAPSIGTDLYSQRVTPTIIAQIAIITPKVLSAEKMGSSKKNSHPPQRLPKRHVLVPT